MNNYLIYYYFGKGNKTRKIITTRGNRTLARGVPGQCFDH